MGYFSFEILTSLTRVCVVWLERDEGSKSEIFLV